LIFELPQISNLPLANADKTVLSALLDFLLRYEPDSRFSLLKHEPRQVDALVLKKVTDVRRIAQLKRQVADGRIIGKDVHRQLVDFVVAQPFPIAF